jgi:lipoyl(octanoyl) transferase
VSGPVQQPSIHPVVQDLGLRIYPDVLELQQRLWQRRRDGNITDTILLVEHLPVITLGAHRSSNKLLEDEVSLMSRGIDIVSIRRGGGITAHNPGQLVVYPIIELAGLGLGIREYVHRLEDAGMALLAELGVQAVRREGLHGLWVQARKIASIGVRVSRGVTYHGMAVNICNDLAIFDTMVPCGLDGVQMTSVLEESEKRWDMSLVKQKAASILVQHFEM